MRYVDLPAKVLSGTVSSSVGLGAWPYDDGTGDPFWAGGITPRAYRWLITMSIIDQQHSSHKTRAPYVFNGMDVSVGDYVADSTEGVCVKITAIISKTDSNVVCEVEDYLRYNTLRYKGKTGVGIFNVPTDIIVFSLNEEGMPVVDPVPSSGVGTSFFPNVMSRFDNIEQDMNFELTKIGHDFEVGDLVSADSTGNTFVKTSSSYPYIIGTVSGINAGPDKFFINPIQKILDNMDYLIGDIGDVIYADPVNAGAYSLTGTIPVMIKLRNNTFSTSRGTVFGATTDAGCSIRLNGVDMTFSVGNIDDCVDTINLTTADHGVTASKIASPVVIQTDIAQCANGEPAFLSTGATATINGVLVTFNTSTVGMATYGAAYPLEEDMAQDINAANIPNVVATTSGNKLILTNASGGSITITNGLADSNGTFFAGPSSASGLPLSSSGGSAGEAILLTAVDARAINMYDVSGQMTTDFGLASSENGIKAAALYIEQGIRQASTYVVASIPARNALSAVFGDQCFVQDTGNGEWGYYIYTLDSEWVQISNKDSSETDAKSVEVEVEWNSATEGLIHTISNGRRVTFVTVTVVVPFDNGAVISVGDESNHDILMTEDQNDLSVASDYSTTPSYTYVNGGDTDIRYYLNTNGATQGKAVVAITYT